MVVGVKARCYSDIHEPVVRDAAKVTEVNYQIVQARRQIDPFRAIEKVQLVARCNEHRRLACKERHADNNFRPQVGPAEAVVIELRIVPNLWPLWNRVVASSLEFSGIRLHNALPAPGL